MTHSDYAEQCPFLLTRANAYGKCLKTPWILSCIPPLCGSRSVPAREVVYSIRQSKLAGRETPHQRVERRCRSAKGQAIGAFDFYGVKEKAKALEAISELALIQK